MIWYLIYFEVSKCLVMHKENIWMHRYLFIVKQKKWLFPKTSIIFMKYRGRDMTNVILHEKKICIFLFQEFFKLLYEKIEGK